MEEPNPVFWKVTSIVTPTIYLVFVGLVYVFECMPYWKDPQMHLGNLTGVFLIPVTLPCGLPIMWLTGWLIPNSAPVPVTLLPLVLGGIVNAYLLYRIIRQAAQS